MRSSKYSRDQLASLLSIMLGRTITAHVLNNITSTSKPHHADIFLVKGICALTGAEEPLEIFLDGLGPKLVHKEDVPLFEMHKLLLQKRRIEEQLADLEGQIKHGSK